MIVKKEWAYLSIFSASIVLISLVFQVSWERVLALTPNSLISSCQAVSNYIFNWYFPLRVSLLGLLAGLLSVAVFTVAKAWVTSMRLKKRAVQHSPKLKKVIQSHQLAADRVIEIRDSQPVAVTVGLFQPTIVVSSKLVRALSPKQLSAVLLHEQHHQQQYHPILFVIGRVVSQALWFIPSLTDVSNHMKVTLEIAADAAVTDQQGTNLYLKRALAKVLSLATPERPHQYLYHYPSFAKDAIDYRVAQLTSAAARSSAQLVFSSWKAFVSLVMVLVMSGFVVIRPTATVTAQTSPASSSCTLFKCVSSCVQDELMSRAPMLSPVQASQ